MQTYRVLIVDDDEVDRMRVRRALERAEFKCEIGEASTVADGRARIMQGGFDCLFVDYRLPDGDGLEFIRTIRRQNLSNKPVVAMTGEGSERLAVDLMKAGATDYIPKDEMIPERILKCFRAAMRIHRAESEADTFQKQSRKIEEELAELKTRLSDLHRVLEGLGNCATREQFGASLAERARALFPGWSASVYISNEVGDSMRLVAAWGNPIAPAPTLTLDACGALRQGSVRRLDATGIEPRCPHVSTTAAISTLCIPLRAQGSVVGLLALQSSDSEGGSPSASADSIEPLTLLLADALAIILPHLGGRILSQSQEAGGQGRPYA